LEIKKENSDGMEVTTTSIIIMLNWK